jgi:hypothetical protein
MTSLGEVGGGEVMTTSVGQAKLLVVTLRRYSILSEPTRDARWLSSQISSCPKA